MLYSGLTKRTAAEIKLPSSDTKADSKDTKTTTSSTTTVSQQPTLSDQQSEELILKLLKQWVENNASIFDETAALNPKVIAEAKSLGISEEKFIQTLTRACGTLSYAKPQTLDKLWRFIIFDYLAEFFSFIQNSEHSIRVVYPTTSTGLYYAQIIFSGFRKELSRAENIANKNEIPNKLLCMPRHSGTLTLNTNIKFQNKKLYVVARNEVYLAVSYFDSKLKPLLDSAISGQQITKIRTLVDDEKSPYHSIKDVVLTKELFDIFLFRLCLLKDKDIINFSEAFFIRDQAKKSLPSSVPSYHPKIIGIFKNILSGTNFNFSTLASIFSNPNVLKFLQYDNVTREQLDLLVQTSGALSEEQIKIFISTSIPGYENKETAQAASSLTGNHSSTTSTSESKSTATTSNSSVTSVALPPAKLKTLYPKENQSSTQPENKQTASDTKETKSSQRRVQYSNGLIQEAIEMTKRTQHLEHLAYRTILFYVTYGFPTDHKAIFLQEVVDNPSIKDPFDTFRLLEKSGSHLNNLWNRVCAESASAKTLASPLIPPPYYISDPTGLGFKKQQIERDDNFVKANAESIKWLLPKFSAVDKDSEAYGICKVKITHELFHILLLRLLHLGIINAVELNSAIHKRQGQLIDGYFYTIRGCFEYVLSYTSLPFTTLERIYQSSSTIEFFSENVPTLESLMELLHTLYLTSVLSLDETKHFIQSIKLPSTYFPSKNYLAESKAKDTITKETYFLRNALAHFAHSQNIPSPKIVPSKNGNDGYDITMSVTSSDEFKKAGDCFTELIRPAGSIFISSTKLDASKTYSHTAHLTADQTKTLEDFYRKDEKYCERPTANTSQTKLASPSSSATSNSNSTTSSSTSTVIETKNSKNNQISLIDQFKLFIPDKKCPPGFDATLLMNGKLRFGFKDQKFSDEVKAAQKEYYDALVKKLGYETNNELYWRGYDFETTLVLNKLNYSQNQGTELQPVQPLPRLSLSSANTQVPEQQQQQASTASSGLQHPPQNVL